MFRIFKKKEMQNLRTNLRGNFSMKSAWEEAPQLMSPWSPPSPSSQSPFQDLLTALLLFSGVRSSSASSHQPKLTTTTWAENYDDHGQNDERRPQRREDHLNQREKNYVYLHWFEPWPSIFVLCGWKTSSFPLLLLLLLESLQSLFPERLFFSCTSSHFDRRQP